MEYFSRELTLAERFVLLNCSKHPSLSGRSGPPTVTYTERSVLKHRLAADQTYKNLVAFLDAELVPTHTDCPNMLWQLEDFVKGSYSHLHMIRIDADRKMTYGSEKILAKMLCLSLDGALTRDKDNRYYVTLGPDSKDLPLRLGWGDTMFIDPTNWEVKCCWVSDKVRKLNEPTGES